MTNAQFQSHGHKAWFMEVGTASPPHLVTLYLCAFKEDGGRGSLTAPVAKSCEGKEESGLGFTSWPVELEEWPPHASSTLAAPRLLITLLHSQYRSWRNRKTESNWDLAFTSESVELGGKNQVSFGLYDVHLHLLRWGHLPGAYYSYTYLILSVNWRQSACRTFKTVLRFCKKLWLEFCTYTWLSCKKRKGRPKKKITLFQLGSGGAHF